MNSTESVTLLLLMTLGGCATHDTVCRSAFDLEGWTRLPEPPWLPDEAIPIIRIGADAEVWYQNGNDIGFCTLYTYSWNCARNLDIYSPDADEGEKFRQFTESCET